MDLSFNALRKCGLCPRNCNADRFKGNSGFCHTDYKYNVSSVVIHKGEEPPISGDYGTSNIFFNHCNLQCVFCQNHQISNNLSLSNFLEFEGILQAIDNNLNKGCRTIGFVTPSHQIPQMVSIIKAFENYSPKPIFVYNTNAYDKVDVLKSLEGLIDIYLPDFKYAFDSEKSFQYSSAHDYATIAKLAIKEMFRQKGAQIRMGDNNYAESGLIIRHLVIPGFIDNSIAILKFIAEELSENVHISMMSQYNPVYNALLFPEIDRRLSKSEYESILKKLEELNLENGWVQALESSGYYLPDFDNSHPFTD
jgi:putative pyruvate formate lyase activating enzyme